MKINFIGDCVFTNQSEFDEFFTIIKNTDNYKKADIIFANLEAPIVLSEKGKISKFGPHLRASEKIDFRGSDKIVWCLANNHTMDYGRDGLEKCLRILREQNQRYIGVNIPGSEYFFSNTDRSGICVLNVCENEIGCDALDSLTTFDHLKVAKKIIDVKNKNDQLILFIHGGVEHSAVPSAEQKDICLRLMELGADAVIYSHSHKISRTFTRDEKLTCYGLGNFYFKNFGRPATSYLDSVRSSLLLDVNDIRSYRLEYIPIEEDCLDEEMIARELSEIQRIEEDEYEFSAYWSQWINDRLDSMLVHILFPKFFRGSRLLGSSSKFRKIFVHDNAVAHKLNIMTCASLREIYVQALKKYLANEFRE